MFDDSIRRFIDPTSGQRGFEVGACVGTWIGGGGGHADLEVGDNDGKIVGPDVGRADGVNDGLVVGVAVGIVDGVDDGLEVGPDVGSIDGADDGLVVGPEVGNIDGGVDGTEAGTGHVGFGVGHNGGLDDGKPIEGLALGYWLIVGEAVGVWNGKGPKDGFSLGYWLPVGGILGVALGSKVEKGNKEGNEGGEGDIKGDDVGTSDDGITGTRDGTWGGK